MAMKQLQGLMKPLKKYTKMTLTALCSRRSKAPAREPNYAFMNIEIKIDVKGPGWQKIVAKVLNGIKGVVHFNMEHDGTVAIAGKVDPPLLLKRLGKAGARASIKHWHYGLCSSNLYSFSNPYSHNNSNQYQRNNMYYSQGQGYYPANRGYGYDVPYGGNDYGYAPYGNNDYGGYGGSSSHYGRGRQSGYCGY